MNSIEDIQDGSQIHTEINATDAILKIRDRIKQTKSELKVSELSANSMGKVLHKIFKSVLD